MSDSDDDTSIPTLPTARKPGYSPPIDYVQYLDMGGELAKLGKDFWAEMRVRRLQSRTQGQRGTARVQAGLFEHNVTGDIIHVGELQYATDDQLRVTPTIPLSEVVLKRHPGRNSQ